MDRVFTACVCLSLALLSTPTSATEMPGAAEYQAALETGARLLALGTEMFAAADDQAKQLPESAKAQKRDQVLAYAASYTQQLKAAADLGFAPAQYVYAQTLKMQALAKPAQRAALKAQACALLDEAATRGLLMATFGKSPYCATFDARDMASMLKAGADAYALLAATIERPDPYAAYYPLKAPHLVECWEPAHSPLDESLSPLEKLQAGQPPALSFDETRAEIFYQLAIREYGNDNALAKQHLDKADVLGCSSRGFVNLQTRVDKKLNP